MKSLITFSFKPKTINKLRNYCKTNNLVMSGYVENMVNKELGAEE